MKRSTITLPSPVYCCKDQSRSTGLYETHVKVVINVQYDEPVEISLDVLY